MRYPVIGGVQLGQVTDSDFIRLENQLSSTLFAFNSLPDDKRAEMAADMRLCEDAASWARTTRKVQDLIDAEACLGIIAFDILNAQPVFTSEDAQPPVSGPGNVQVAPEPQVLERRSSPRPWPIIGIGVGALILGGAVYLAIKG